MNLVMKVDCLIQFQTAVLLHNSECAFAQLF